MDKRAELMALAVTQADREAAAQLCVSPTLAAILREGRDDAHSLVIGLARHRISSLSGVEELVGALEGIGKFVENYYAPWGSWKTAWWEGEVSDDAAFSADNALKHVANLLTPALAKHRAGQGEGR